MSPVTDLPGLADLRFAVVDVETTGLEPARHHILQMAVVITDATGVELESWSTYVKPPHWPLAPLGPRAIHGITLSTLRGAPHVREALGELAGRLAGRVFTAHNAEFDFAFVQRQARRSGVSIPPTPVVCTLTLSRALDPGFSRSHRLADLCARYRVPPGRAHDALSDARAAAALLPHLIGDAGITSVGQLLALAGPSALQPSPTAPETRRAPDQRAAS